MKLFESFIHWLERRYSRKLEKYCLTHGRDFEATARPHLRDQGGYRNPYPQGKRWLLMVAIGCVNDIAMYRVRVAMPFNLHSVNQMEIYHER